jgi:hypothetical protein
MGCVPAQETTRAAGASAVRTVRGLTLRVCDPAASSSTSDALSLVLPFLLHRGGLLFQPITHDSHRNAPRFYCSQPPFFVLPTPFQHVSLCFQPPFNPVSLCFRFNPVSLCFQPRFFVLPTQHILRAQPTLPCSQPDMRSSEVQSLTSIFLSPH